MAPSAGQLHSCHGRVGVSGGAAETPPSRSPAKPSHSQPAQLSSTCRACTENVHVSCQRCALVSALVVVVRHAPSEALTDTHQPSLAKPHTSCRYNILNIYFTVLRSPCVLGSSARQATSSCVSSSDPAAVCRGYRGVTNALKIGVRLARDSNVGCGVVSLAAAPLDAASRPRLVPCTPPCGIVIE
jgi:hypothetical protein